MCSSGGLWVSIRLPAFPLHRRCRPSAQVARLQPLPELKRAVGRWAFQIQSCLKPVERNESGDQSALSPSLSFQSQENVITRNSLLTCPWRCGWGLGNPFRICGRRRHQHGSILGRIGRVSLRLRSRDCSPNANGVIHDMMTWRSFILKIISPETSTHIKNPTKTQRRTALSATRAISSKPERSSVGQKGKFRIGSCRYYYLLVS